MSPISYNAGIAVADTVERPFSHPLVKAFEQTEYGQLVLRTPQNHTHIFTGRHAGPSASLFLHDREALDALLQRGEVGFAETYMDGLWDTDDLPALLAFGLANADVLEQYFHGRPLYALWLRVSSLLHRNSISGSRRNIMQHYDLGNEFYALWLDKSMTYSGALFGGNPGLSLEEAQQAKYRRILDKLQVQPGDHILEIGCGWGGFAEAAARVGAVVTGITLSEAQKAYADKRMAAAGLSDRVIILLTDYREVDGRFDHIVSIGMFEHVGEQYWPVYFNVLKSLLKPCSRAIVQSITIDDEVFERNRNKYGFIETYIFPGGLLPSHSAFRAAAEKSGLQCSEIFTFGQDYALTTARWLKRFDAQEKTIRSMGYDSTFIRMWRMYLASCIAAFATGRTSVMQAELAVPAG